MIAEALATYGPYIMQGLQIAAPLIQQAIGSAMSGNSSASGVSSGSQYQQSISGGANNQNGWQYANSSQQGSIGSIGGLLNQALGTPTGSNWKEAFAANQASAQTANNLQTGTWTMAQGMNALSNITANLGNLWSQTSAMNYNRAEAKMQRDWQEQMASTAYQRTMEDMKKAGLNPILAATNGATGFGTGASASTSHGQFSQMTSAAVPSAHTANAQTMYDYGNNTMQFLNNAMQTINTAKQFGYNSMANGLTQSMFQVADTSSKSINEYAQKAEQYAEQHLRDLRKSNGSNSSNSSSMGGGKSSGLGAGRGR